MSDHIQAAVSPNGGSAKDQYFQCGVCGLDDAMSGGGVGGASGSDEERRPSGEADEGRAGRGLPAPRCPTPTEREHHERTHIPYRSWCDVCVAARGVRGPHRRQEVDHEKYQDCQIGVDYWFIGRGQGDGAERHPMVVLYERTKRYLSGHRVKGKGADQQAAKMLANDLDALGIRRAVYRTDQERSVMALMDAVKIVWSGELVPEEAARESPIPMLWRKLA